MLSRYIGNNLATNFGQCNRIAKIFIKQFRQLLYITKNPTLQKKSRTVAKFLSYIKINIGPSLLVQCTKQETVRIKLLSFIYTKCNILIRQ